MGAYSLFTSRGISDFLRAEFYTQTLKTQILKDGTSEITAHRDKFAYRKATRSLSHPNRRGGGHIAFGADPIDIRVASCLHSYLLNQ